MITADQLRAVMPRCKVSEFLDPLNRAMAEFSINTPARTASFLAQLAHESSQLCTLSENLNYSIAGLMKTWPARFQSVEYANRYAHQPEKIANLIYANRMGNGDEASGDGWKYRGAGGIQLTGKSNQAKCAGYMGVPVDLISAWLLTSEGAVRSAAWFWKVNGLNEIADSGDQMAMRKRVNGGYNGAAEVLAYFNVANKAIA